MGTSKTRPPHDIAAESFKRVRVLKGKNAAHRNNIKVITFLKLGLMSACATAQEEHDTFLDVKY